MCRGILSSYLFSQRIMIKSIVYLLILTVFLVACESSSEKTPPPTTPSTVNPGSINNTGLVTKGSMLFGSKDDASVYLEAQLIHLEAELANKKADSLRLAYKNDASNIDVNFELGTNFAVLGGFTLEDEGNCRDSALLLLTHVIETNPKYKNGAAYFNRAQTYATDKKWEKAIQDINTYLEIDPEPTAYTQLILANANYAKGDTTKACEHYNTMQEALGESYNSATSIWEERCQ